MSQTQDFLQAPFTSRSINKKQYIKRSLTTIIQLNNMLGHLKKAHAMELGYQHKILSSDINLGQIQLSLSYNNKTKTIQIHVLKAIGLQLPKYFLNSAKIPNSYVKIYMIYRGQRVDKKQTTIVMETRDPMFDQKFEFNILNLLQLSQPMDNASFEPESSEMEDKNDSVLSHQISSRIQFVFLVMDWDKVEKNDVIGKLELNTQHHLQRIIKNQSINFDSNCQLKQMSSQNWFDIFYQPNQPILCTFQIKNY
ncbi:synaptotagmin-4 isoform X2 [Brachionus plicatilis]|uniref:Synaptotagmin-4 isoform X2 n=1 Tax=Brachionus plicatilis TaxID=10195 RepID=A0A3M7PT84_BRAPC|nr:synaptotagmin-4 isoform X2 [Brachionus plicatilis]